MSEKNVEIVRRWMEAYDRRDIEDMISVSGPEIEFRSVFAGMESGGVFRWYAGSRITPTRSTTRTTTSASSRKSSSTRALP